MTLVSRLKKQFATLLAALLLMQLAPIGVLAQSRLRQKSDEESNNRPQDVALLKEVPQVAGSWRRKISPDLERSADMATTNRRFDKTARVIIRLSDNKLSVQSSGGNMRASSRGIMVNDSVRAEFATKLASHSGKVKEMYSNVGLVSAELPLSRIRELEYDNDVAYISPDLPISGTGHIENITGTLQVRGLVSGITLDGTGIGVAVLDSGIDTNHKLEDTAPTHPGVVFTKNFTGVTATRDNYGHGTHVASLIAGDSAQSPFTSTKYRGIAPQAKLLNLRVLKADGTGSVSDAIAAIDWSIANKATYNIRVMNLSIATAVKDSYVNDPLCQAARRAVNAGIV